MIKLYKFNQLYHFSSIFYLKIDSDSESDSVDSDSDSVDSDSESDLSIRKEIS